MLSNLSLYDEPNPKFATLSNVVHPLLLKSYTVDDMVSVLDNSDIFEPKHFAALRRMFRKLNSDVDCNLYFLEHSGVGFSKDLGWVQPDNTALFFYLNRSVQGVMKLPKNGKAER